MTTIIIATAIETDIIQIQSWEELEEGVSLIVLSSSLAEFKSESLINVFKLLPVNILLGSLPWLIPSILTNNEFLKLPVWLLANKPLLIASLISIYLCALSKSLLD